MYYTYILYSTQCDRYYIGFTSDTSKRLERHNSGMVNSTRNCIPYLMLKFKSYATAEEARKEEMRIKKMKSRKYIKKLLEEDW